ncbi:hypothetical protein DFS34DRAFT_648262 [Phlyctochytrium arcticum]|nr:hypothetical protein DFS34DRAFT_648262 [Phlyctochytrium arcticum]
MSEYWVSNKKFFCKYCRIYVTDNKISRQNHETGLKHKNNIAAYLQDVNKRAEEKSATNSETMAMLAQIDEAANKQYSRETGYQRGGREWDPIKEAEKERNRNWVPPTDHARKVIPDVVFPIRPYQPPPVILDPSEEAAAPEETHPYGSWETIDIPVPSPSANNESKEDINQQPKGAGGKVNDWADYGEEEPPEESAKDFKVREKVLEADSDTAEVAAPAVFKKRKVGASKAVKNARKKID